MKVCNNNTNELGQLSKIIRHETGLNSREGQDSSFSLHSKLTSLPSGVKRRNRPLMGELTPLPTYVFMLCCLGAVNLLLLQEQLHFRVDAVSGTTP